MSERLSEFRTWLQWAVVRAQAYRLPGLFLRWLCRVGANRIGKHLMEIPGVESVYVRHTHPRSPSFVPGHSDLDLTVVLTEQVAASPGTVEAVAEYLEHRRLFHYYLSPDDARMTTPGELALMTGKWPPVEILAGPESWTLLAGREVRREDGRILPFSQVPTHPEFNRWWGHILQDYLLRTLPGEENRYHRVIYRGAIKQVAYFMLARGMVPPAHESFKDRVLVQWVMDSHPQLESMLKELEKNGFWSDREGDIRERIFHEVLRITTDFYADSAAISRPVRASEANPADLARHVAAYDSLAAKLNTLPDLKSRLAGVFVYPTPYCQPYFYQADLLLADDTGLEELSTVAALIRRAFNGRGITSEGHYYAVTLVPAGVFRAPLVYRGSPFPFLAEHVARYGRVLFGQHEKPGFPGEQDLIEWCRMFLPFFTSNLHRRIEHSSRTLNFCHIAAVHLFLETGEIVTDSALLKTRHQALFGKDSPTDELWGYLFRDKPGRGEHDLYLAASEVLQSELVCVEQLMDERDNQEPVATRVD